MAQPNETPHRPDGSPRWLFLGLKTAVIAIPVVTVLLLVPVYVPALRYALLTALRRDFQCSFSQALNSGAYAKDRTQRMQEIRASAHLVQSDDNYSLWHTRDGDFWIPNRNADTLVFNLTEQEQDIYGRGVDAVRAGDVVLDCGANVGVFTRKALDAGAKTVIAIEPAPENVEVLRRTFAQEIASGRVVLQPVGVWNEPAELPMRVDGSNSARNSFVIDFGATTSTIKIPLRTIDSIVDELGLASVDFIKMDIEGAEKNALAGAIHTLTRFHPRLAIAMEHLEDDPVAIPAAIQSMGLGYETVCGPCIDFASYVRPDTPYFRPRSN
jgi:FkbM family methyltransferase